MIKSFYRTGLSRASLCCLFLFTALIPVSLAEEDSSEEGNPELIGYVKLPPIKALTSDVMEVLRKLQPGPQTEMAAFYFLGPFGYPKFPGVSETDDVVIVFYEDEAGHPGPMVVFAKVAGESPLLTTVPQGGWYVEMRGEWALIAPEESFLQAVKDIEPLKVLSALPRKTDVEAVLSGDALARHKDNLKMLTLLGSGVPLGGPESEKVHSAMDVIDIFITRTAAFEALRIGLDVSPETFAIAFSGKARADTPEAALLSQQAGGAVEEAKFIPADKPMYWMSRFDPKTMQTYYDFLAEEYTATLDEAQAAQVDSIMESMRAMTTLMNGGGAGSTTMSDANLDMVQIASGDLDNDTLIAMLEDSLTNSRQLTEAVMNSFGKLAHFDITQDITFEKNVLEVEGVSVHRSHSELEHTMLVATGGEPTDEEFQSVEAALYSGEATTYEPGHSITTRQNNYYAVLDGDYLSASTKEGIERLITSVVSQEAAKPSVADYLELPSGRMLAMHLNLVDVVVSSVPDTLSSHAQGRLAALAESGLPPMSMYWDVGEGEFLARLNIPIETLAQLSQTMNELMVEESRQQTQPVPALPDTQAPVAEPSTPESAGTAEQPAAE